ncbi:cytochrome c oxidase subunit 8B, mitochondrial [Carassius gibelio]|uniref:cytochrome c oxidase subunit 8B, mitochondrial n=1 Tax=Carassius gibelio TaxID=101364 RepID=UPI00227967E2|nr:cytochrome c oxidase subunit 8B, mitochondrial [Carassius gibelio]
MMFGFVRALKCTRYTPKQNVLTQRFYINSKSAKSGVGAVESVFVMAFISIAVLGPAGWILSNSCDSHRKRP